MLPTRLHLRLMGLLVIPLAMTASTAPETHKKAEYAIQGVFCSGCIGALTEAARQLEGVGEVTVDVEARLVYVTFDEEKVSAEEIMKHINTETTFNLALNEAKSVETTSGSGTDGVPCC